MPEATATREQANMPEFELISQVNANGMYPVTKYRSKSTGLELIHAEVPGPIVNGYIVLATRAEDDDGLPHTLEHMIFIGSEEYPYKGVLDILANKCLASGTNAWTDVDHTCYTMTTAGSEGFCTLLPIYMDHIFFPTLSDSAFHTEVYHINGEGKDGGVVYSEMQALEHTSEIKAHTAMVKELYPKSSGYHYETGGRLANLRDSCNNEKVKAFHTKFYNPRNTRVIVTGMVEPTELFKALDPVVKKLQTKKAVPSAWTRPWLDDVPAPSKKIEKTVKFASEEGEDDAVVLVGFHGPSAIHELSEVHALRLLMEYLTDSTVSPLQKEFVETEDPLASSVEYSSLENSRTSFYLQLEGVPMEQSAEIPEKTRQVLSKQLEEFDMDRMHMIVRKNYLEELSSMENTPHNSIAYACIGDFLYSKDESNTTMFEERVSVAKIIKQFLEVPKTYWTERIQKLILDKTWISVYAKPSKDQHDLQIREEQGRVEERLHKFGEEGLKKLEHDLEEAVAKNMVPVPMSFVQKIATPSVDSISFHNIKRLVNPEDFGKNINCNFYFDDIATNFAYITVLIDTSSLPLDQRKYLSLFCEAITESDIKLDDGTTMGYEDVVAELNKDFLAYNCGIGIDGGSRFKCGSYSHIMSFSAQMEISKLGRGFEWIKRLFSKTEFKGDRLKVLANKMSTEVNQQKRKGSRMAKLLLKDMIYDDKSNMNVTSMIRQQIFLKDLATTVAKSDGKVRKILENIRDLIKDPANVTVHLATNKDNVKNVHKDVITDDALPTEWTGVFHYKEPVRRLANTPDIKYMKDLQQLMDKPPQYVLGLSAEESSFLVQSIKAVTDFNDPELPAILTTLQYFTQTEGPFYRAIRGAGLAYGYFMDSRANEGQLYFYLYRSSDLVGAYKTALDTVQEHLNGKQEWQEDLLDTAKSSLIFEIIEGEKTPLQLASTSLCLYYRNSPGDHTKRLMKNVSQVSMQDLKSITDKYLTPLFLKPCACAAVCPTDKVSTIVDGMAKMGKVLKIMPSIGSSFLSK